MKSIAFIGALLVSSLAASQAKPPNIILILTDDQGYGDLGRHGHPLLKTPHLDDLHDESVRFDNFYVSPSCSPTRAALLTGMHEFRNGVTHTIVPREQLDADAITLPQLLREGGYRTGFIGKWHLGHDKTHGPENRGFDWVSTNVGGSGGHFNPDIIRNGKRMKCEGFREDLFFDEAMTFIDESKDQPFFCYLATYSPHTPLAAPEEAIAPYRGAISEDQATYLAMIANIDDNVGRLLAFLKERDLEDDTIVIFMNDNGVTVGLDVYNAGMRGCKCTIWQGGTRAISFWRWPKHWPAHTVGKLTAHLDVLPTLCEVSGVEVPDDLKPKLEGFSLVPLLESKEPVKWHDERMLFQHVGRWPSGLAESHKYAMGGVRQGNYLLLRSRPCDDPACKGQQSQCATLRNVLKGQVKATYTDENAAFHWGVSAPDRWSLFDIKADPECRHDLELKTPERTDSMAKAYDQWWDGIFPQMMEAGGDKGAEKIKAQREASPAGRYDLNADGKVSLKEFQKFYGGVFSRKDINKDGVLESSEFPLRAFKAADADKDGKLTSSEFGKLYSGQFKKRDKNHDGALTGDEL